MVVVIVLYVEGGGLDATYNTLVLPHILPNVTPAAGLHTSRVLLKGKERDLGRNIYIY